MKGNRGVGNAVIVTVAGRLCAPFAALATAPIMAHALGVDGRGAVAAVTAPLFLATTAGTFGVPATVTYSIAQHPGAVRGPLVRGLLLVMLAGLVVTGALWAARDWSAAGDSDLAALIALASCAVIPSLVVLVLQAVASGERRWNLILAERSVAAVLRLGVFAALAITNSLSITSAILTLAFSPIVGGVVYLSLLRPHPAAVPPEGKGRIGSAEMAFYGLRVWIGSIAGVLSGRLDQVLLAPLVGIDSLGLYVVAVTISEVPRVISDAARDVTFSADAHDQNDARLARTARLSALAVTVVSLIGAATLWWSVPLLFGSEFTAAIPATLVLLFSTVIGSGSGVAGIALVARGRPGVRSIAIATASGINAVLLLALAPAIGLMGAAIATAAGSFVLFGLNLLFLRTHLGVRSRDLIGVRRADLEMYLPAFWRLTAMRG